MQANMKGHPKIACPNCGARLMNAADKEIKNGTRVAVSEDSGSYDYFIFCKKCNTTIGIQSARKCEYT